MARFDDLVRVPVESHFAGDYRLEYDGKYITLFGKDRGYTAFGYGATDESFEEMVLVPVVIEVRRASPMIIRVTDVEIVIKLNQEDIPHSTVEDMTVGGDECRKIWDESKS